MALEKRITINDKEFTYEANPAHTLGSGGFGTVYYGKDSEGIDLAIKRLNSNTGNKTPREIEIVNKLIGQNDKFIVPVLEAGLNILTNEYFIVMPVCDISLEKHVAQNSKISLEEAKTIILDILNGLKELTKYDMVHRDIKPSNILKHEGTWKIADFGISKIMQFSNNTSTLNHIMSKEYAAPEQWENRPPTEKTDIYALGCIIYFILTKNPPFSSDFRNNHLKTTPDKILSIPADYASFILRMLFKPEASRPNTNECIKKFTSQTPTQSLKMKELLEKISHKQLNETIAKKTIETNFDIIESIKIAGDKILDSLIEDLFSSIQLNCMAEINSSKSISFNNSTLRLLQKSEKFSEITTSKHILIASAVIEANYRTSSRSSSLVYMKNSDDDSYDWYEISFYSPFGVDTKDSPYGLKTEELNETLIFNKMITVTTIAHEPKKPIKITGESRDDFIERWTYLFCQAIDENFEQLNFPYNILSFYK